MDNTPTSKASLTHPGPLWHIVRQDFNVQYVQGAPPRDIVDVYFRTRSGVESHVTLPRESYSAPNVAKLVIPLAEEIERTATLNHDNAQGLS